MLRSIITPSPNSWTLPFPAFCRRVRRRVLGCMQETKIHIDLLGYFETTQRAQVRSGHRSRGEYWTDCRLIAFGTKSPGMIRDDSGWLKQGYTAAQPHNDDSGILTSLLHSAKPQNDGAHSLKTPLHCNRPVMGLFTRNDTFPFSWCFTADINHRWTCPWSG